MTKITVVLTEDGQLDSVLSDSEIYLSILKKGTDDNAIDVAETTLDPIELN